MKKNKKFLLSKYIPKRKTFARLHKGKLKIFDLTAPKKKIQYNSCALISLKPARLNIRYMEVARLLIARSFKTNRDRTWTRINTSIPITKKPNENRMGKGKGKVFTYISRISSGKVLLETASKSPKHSFLFAQITAKKLSIPSYIWVKKSLIIK